MKSKNNDLAELQHALVAETALIQEISNVCADSATWVEDPGERVTQMSSLTQVSAALAAAQASTASLLKAWKETHVTLPESIQKAISVKRQLLDAAIEAVRKTAEKTHTSKEALMRGLADTNQSKEMLSAYGKRETT